jgi:hypothetical protein
VQATWEVLLKGHRLAVVEVVIVKQHIERHSDRLGATVGGSGRIK